MTQRVQPTSRSVLVARFEKMLNAANLTESEVRRIDEQIEDFFNAGNYSLRDFLHHARRPYLNLSHERIHESLRTPIVLTVRRDAEVLDRWHYGYEWQRKQLESEFREETEDGVFRLVFAEYHVGSQERLQNLLNRRSFRLANFWELAAFGQFLRKKRILDDGIWVKGEGPFHMRKFGRSTYVTERNPPGVCGRYLVRIKEKRS